MDFSDIFRVVNLGAGVLMVLAGVTRFIPTGFTIPSLILAIYLFIFGLSTALLEFQIPPQVARYASFMFSFVGRGAFYIFVGMLSVDEHWYKWLPGSILALIGLGYVALEFVPSIEPPANMRDASDSGWGAEQV